MLVLIIAGCETSTKRDCPAFFHPDYETWGQHSVGETLVFDDRAGMTERFDVTKIERSVPFQTEDFGSRESNVVCNLTVREVLVRQDSEETILKFFKHSEFSDRDLDNELFSLSIYIGPLATDQGARDFLILLDDNSSESDSITFYDELELGGVLYTNVYIAVREAEQESPEQISAIAIASGFGLVQYTRANGSVFSLVQ